MAPAVVRVIERRQLATKPDIDRRWAFAGPCADCDRGATGRRANRASNHRGSRTYTSVYGGYSLVQ